ncbi:MerR family transcriptional regulator [Clostridium sp. YIM B02551]|uniref:MerR family transcriptional regulator n=1 Tax=Clostridium sp. YIM B02551 TaxID=2910679 RepID=UPI001EEABB96|nr:MerR family transcriptional regulator [Clostridium sp. YIM B02551]
MKNYTIKDLVKHFNINKETIRYYEKIGLLEEPKRDNNGYRVYSKEDFDKITFILILKSYGFSLKEIKELLSKIYDEILGADVESIKKIVISKIYEINSIIKELDNTRRLLEKINDNILSSKRENCDDIEMFLKK